jgi:Methylase involved in ubiquinone/menaquinone biosynthesis
MFLMKKQFSVGNGIIIDGKWSFNKNVTKKFEKHIKKSIPFYEVGHDLILKCIEIYLEDHPNKKEIVITDLGCSTGTLIKKISDKFYHKPLIIYALDKEPSMIEKAKKRKYSLNHQIHWINSAIEDYDLEKSDMVICYYILQFIEISRRQEIINKIYKKLNKKGLFLFFEKIKSEQKDIEQINQKIITKFKIEQGFSFEEIQNKEKSLKGILIPLTIKDNFRLLDNAGFKNYETILQYSLFLGMIAIK